MIKRRVEAVIDLNAVLNNYNYIKSKLNSDTKLLSVVKADAYGHGSVEVCRMLEENGATEFAVACIEEAIALREGGIKGNILILGIRHSMASSLCHFVPVLNIRPVRFLMFCSS